jgi:hypothetical protein
MSNKRPKTKEERDTKRQERIDAAKEAAILAHSI